MDDQFNLRLNTTFRKVFPKPICQMHVNVRYLFIVQLVYKIGDDVSVILNIVTCTNKMKNNIHVQYCCIVGTVL